MNDTRLKRDILASLEWEPEVDAAAIGVTVNDSVATLFGHVTSLLRGAARTWATRDEAERLAWAAPGVVAVENELVVAVPEQVAAPAAS